MAAFINGCNDFYQPSCDDYGRPSTKTIWEIRSGKLITGCECVKRNGLQSECIVPNCVYKIPKPNNDKFATENINPVNNNQYPQNHLSPSPGPMKQVEGNINETSPRNNIQMTDSGSPWHQHQYNVRNDHIPLVNRCENVCECPQQQLISVNSSNKDPTLVSQHPYQNCVQVPTGAPPVQRQPEQAANQVYRQEFMMHANEQICPEQCPPNLHCAPQAPSSSSAPPPKYSGLTEPPQYQYGQEQPGQYPPPIPNNNHGPNEPLLQVSPPNHYEQFEPRMCECKNGNNENQVQQLMRMQGGTVPPNYMEQMSKIEPSASCCPQPQDVRSAQENLSNQQPYPVKNVPCIHACCAHHTPQSNNNNEPYTQLPAPVNEQYQQPISPELMNSACFCNNHRPMMPVSRMGQQYNEFPPNQHQPPFYQNGTLNQEQPDSTPMPQSNGAAPYSQYNQQDKRCVLKLTNNCVCNEIPQVFSQQYAQMPPYTEGNMNQLNNQNLQPNTYPEYQREPIVPEPQELMEYPPQVRKYRLDGQECK